MNEMSYKNFNQLISYSDYYALLQLTLSQYDLEAKGKKQK